jgi:hypothetical protein
MVTAEEKLELILYRVSEAMCELNNFKKDGWATAYHSLSKGMAALDLELDGGNRAHLKPIVKEIESRLYDERKPKENMPV